MSDHPHVSTWTNRSRRGLPMITPPMLAVLQQLRDARDADMPFIDLPGVHGNTLRSLINRDWIFASPGLDGVRYKLTSRGEKALKVYEPLERRYDGICPDCGKNPKHVTRGGHHEGYCLDCLRASAKRARALKLKVKNGDVPCSRCKKRPRHRHKNGTFNTYCDHCKNVMSRRWKRKAFRKKLERARRGELICIRCKTAPRHYTENTVYDYCAACFRAYMIAYNDKRRSGSRAAQQRKAAAR